MHHIMGSCLPLNLFIATAPTKLCQPTRCHCFHKHFHTHAARASLRPLALICAVNDLSTPLLSCSQTVLPHKPPVSLSLFCSHKFSHTQAVDLLLFLLADTPSVGAAKPCLNAIDRERVHCCYAAVKMRQAVCMRELNAQMSAQR